ncbi:MULTISPECIES: AMP-binding protein [Amycolatopsis]|nr:AMP-binding protein [Amycolatopsis bullii]
MAVTPLHEWFTRSAEAHPDRVALEAADAVLTYRELRSAADGLAKALARAGLKPGDRVALLARRSPMTYAGYLATLLAGAVVVPLNPAFPEARNAAVTARAGARTVLDDGALSPVLPPSPGTVEADTAYILFTSGSTGTPKGVPITHGNVASYLECNIRRYRAGPGDRLTQTFDLTFDPSVFDMFVSWGSGATLVVPTPEDVRDPVGFVTRRGITHWFSVPSVVSLARRMRRLTPGGMPGLRCSLFAGEQLTTDQASAWSVAAPASRIENLYGPTELTVTCTGYQLPPNRARWPGTANGTVPIGVCYPHLEHVVLGGDGSRAAEGELCVRGGQRFGGYLDPTDNIGRFVRFDPLDDRPADVVDDVSVTPDFWYRTGDRVRLTDDGGLVHLGRLDAQVQVHGYRVELGEVEATLRGHPKISDAVVLPNDTELRAVYTGAPSTTGELSEWLHRRLPAYMIPRRYHHVEVLPLNPNGKIDRRGLAAMTLPPT